MLNVKQFYLENDLKVLLMPSYKSPVTSMQVWVNTGSADEPEKLAGVSHFIEHLVFKGTKSYGVGEVAQFVEGSGGQLNAYTSFDETVFYVTISSDYTETGLSVLGEMMSSPCFDKKEIDAERGVVIEEIKRSLDSPHRQVFAELFANIYKKHTYGRPVIGYDYVVNKVSRDEIANYFLDKYNASNMTLIVSGDFDSQKIKEQIQKHFSKIPCVPKKKGGWQEEELLRSKSRVFSVKPEGVSDTSKDLASADSRIKIFPRPFKECIFKLSWPTPAISHGDIPALEVLSMLLGEEENSRLMKALRFQSGLANYASSYLFSAKDPGIFVVSVSTQSESLKPCLKILETVFRDFFTEGALAKEVARIISSYKNAQHYLLESVDGLARVAGHYNHFFGDPNHQEKFLESLCAVTPKDIMYVVKKYLSPDKISAFCFYSEKEKGFQPESLIKDFLSEYNKNFHRMVEPQDDFIIQSKENNLDVKSQKKQFIEKTLKTGVKVILKLNYDTPVVSLRIGFQGGVRAESIAGLAELTLRVWESESKNYSEEDILEKSHELSSHVSSFSGKDSVGFSLTTLSWNFEPMQLILQDLILQPTMSEKVLEREKKRMLQEIDLRSDNPAQESMLGFRKTLFQSHPYAKDALGTTESIKKITRNDLINFIGTIKRTDAMVVVLSGALTDPEKFLNSLEEMTKNFPKKAQQETCLFEMTGNREVFLERKKEQSHLVVGYEGIKAIEDQRYVLEVIQGILSGQGGRLFLELRDKNSLAYTVSPLRMDGIETGYFGAYIGCSPDKVKKAYTMLKQEFFKLTSEEVTDEELSRVKRYLVGRYDIGLQSNSAVSSYLLFNSIYGLSTEEIDTFKQKIRGVTKKEILNLSQKIFLSPEVVSLLGPENCLKSLKTVSI